MAAPPLVQPKTSLRPTCGEDKAGTPGSSRPVASYDFCHPDRIPADQLGALNRVQESFAAAFASNLSAYLRTLASVSVAGVEQLSFSEFARKLAPPSTIVPLRMHPLEGIAVLQLSHAAVFPILEILLGGTAKPAVAIDREITQIERCVFEPVLRILLQDLRAAWHAVSPIEFGTEQGDIPAQVVSSIGPREPFLAVAMELRIGEAAGAFHLGIPSRIIRSVVQSSGSQKAAPVEDCSRMLGLIQTAELQVEIRLNGARVMFRDLANLEAGDVLMFDHPLNKELDLELNGTPKFKGHVVGVGHKRGFKIKRPSSGRKG
jgi:flagellar motor switch protein FliM